MKRFLLAAILVLYSSLVFASGTWVATPFVASNFGAVNAMTWTVGAGNVLTNRYTIDQNKMTWNVTLSGTTVAGVPDVQLFIVIPAGKFSPKVQGCTYWSQDTVSNTYDVGLALLPAGNKLYLSHKDANTVWLPGQVSIVLSCTFEIANSISHPPISPSLP